MSSLIKTILDKPYAEYFDKDHSGRLEVNEIEDLAVVCDGTPFSALDIFKRAIDQGQPAEEVLDVWDSLSFYAQNSLYNHPHKMDFERNDFNELFLTYDTSLRIPGFIPSWARQDPSDFGMRRESPVDEQSAQELIAGFEAVAEKYKKEYSPSPEKFENPFLFSLAFSLAFSKTQSVGTRGHTDDQTTVYHLKQMHLTPGMDEATVKKVGYYQAQILTELQQLNIRDVFKEGLYEDFNPDHPNSLLTNSSDV